MGVKFESAIYSTIQISMSAVLGLLGIILLWQYRTEIPNQIIVGIIALLLMKDAIAMAMSAALTWGE
jgi:hypothetical protein